MYSDALRILDINTVHYMIEEQKKEIENGKKEIDSLKQERAELNEAISEKDLLIEQLKAQIAELSS